MKLSLFLIVFTYIALGMFRTIGQIQFLETEAAILTLGSLCLLGFIVFVRQPLGRNQSLVLAAFCALLCYSALFSRYVGVSMIFAYYALCSSMLFVILSQVTSSAPSPTAEGSSPLDNNPSILNLAKMAFISCAGIHVIALIVFYIYKPERTFGLMDDYSQASMLLLLAYGMAYSMFKEKLLFVAFSFLVFLGYFTSFSRTANFLLVLFFIALFVLERKNNMALVVKLAGLAVLAVVLVHVYPSVLNEATVSRGGLSHFSTLNSRTIYWQAAWEGIKQAPLLGNGLGTYAWTGIKEAAPFNNIYFVHNDYLQVWHDLGAIWSILLFGGFFVILVKHAPVNWSVSNLSILTGSPDKFIAWVLLLCIALYMGINFLIVSLEFQAAIAILLVELFRK